MGTQQPCSVLLKKFMANTYTFMNGILYGKKNGSTRSPALSSPSQALVLGARKRVALT